MTPEGSPFDSPEEAVEYLIRTADEIDPMQVSIAACPGGEPHAHLIVEDKQMMLGEDELETWIELLYEQLEGVRERKDE